MWNLTSVCEAAFTCGIIVLTLTLSVSLIWERIVPRGGASLCAVVLLPSMCCTMMASMMVAAETFFPLSSEFELLTLS